MESCLRPRACVTACAGHALVLVIPEQVTTPVAVRDGATGEHQRGGSTESTTWCSLAVKTRAGVWVPALNGSRGNGGASDTVVLASKRVPPIAVLLKVGTVPLARVPRVHDQIELRKHGAMQKLRARRREGQMTQRARPSDRQARSKRSTRLPARLGNGQMSHSLRCDTCRYSTQPDACTWNMSQQPRRRAQSGETGVHTHTKSGTEVCRYAPFINPCSRTLLSRRLIPLSSNGQDTRFSP